MPEITVYTLMNGNASVASQKNRETSYIRPFIRKSHVIRYLSWQNNKKWACRTAARF